MNIIKYQYSIKRKDMLGEHYLHAVEMKFKVTKDLGSEYVLTDDKERYTVVIHKDKRATNEFCLRKLKIDEVRDYHMSFSYWLPEGEDKTIYIKEAKEYITTCLLKERNTLDECIKSMKLL